VSLDVVHQLVCENGLSDSNEDCCAQSLHEDDDSKALRGLADRESCLDSGKGLLKSLRLNVRLAW
jgi:hypothetical protein